MSKILVVEDESALQKTASQILAESGFDVVSALDGEKGVDLAKKETPDLILLDLILPKKDGFAVLEELKKDERTRRIPVVVLSNLAENDDVSKALALGAHSYLIKTEYRLPEVVAKVKEVLAHK